MKVLAFSVLVTLLVYVQTCYGTYVGEGCFVVDDKAVRTYVNEIPGTDSYATKRSQAVNNLKKDLDYFLAEANQLFKSFSTYGFNFEITVKCLYVLEADIYPSNFLENGNIINAGTALQLFKNYLIQQNTYSNSNFDFAMFLTGYDISGDTGISTNGYANVGTMCNNQTAISVVEFNGTYSMSINIARMVAHLLGASNDGIASDRIMAAAIDPRNKRRWEFAECTVMDIKEKLPSINPNCLLQTSPSSVRPSSPWASYTGQLFNHNVICQRAMNTSKTFACLSYTLFNNSAPKGDQICQQLYCSITGTTYCLSTWTSEGLICDKNKRCDNGKCVPDSSPASANVDASCVLGDQQRLESPIFPYNGTCSQYIAEQGKHMCYHGLVTQLCCATCKRHNTGYIGCEYGDKNPQCSVYSKDISCAPQNADVCCQTCRGHVGKRSARYTEVQVETIDAEFNEDQFKKGYQVKFKYGDIGEKVHAD